MRKVTLHTDDELIIVNEDGINSPIDYSKISNNKFIDSIGKEYSYYGELSDYSNEMFINYYVKKKEWEGVVLDDDNLIKSKNNSITHLLWNEVVEGTCQTRQRSSRVWSLLSWLKLFLAYIACFCIVIFRKSKNITNKEDKNFKKIVIVRSKATYSKLSPIADKLSITLISEDIIYTNKNLKSLFLFLTVGQCFKALLKTIKPVIIEYKCLIKEVETIFGPKVANKIIYYYASRVAIKCLFEQLLDVLLKGNITSELVTGNKEDRFAMVEKRLSSKYNILLTCIPHGLEYSYRFPTGIAGDVFFCTSKKAKSILSKLYPSTEFFYDELLQRKMYSISDVIEYTVDRKRDIIFFTESRDIEVNRLIIDELNYLGFLFRVKLHPKDSKNNYLDKKIYYQEDYFNAISNSICICRKSTVLIEAIYNNSISIAYLINSKDRYYVSKIFPSLSDSNIHKCLDNESLAQFI